MQAPIRAADRGVQIRIYLDSTQFAEREPAKVFRDLASTPGVEIRIKRDAGAPMHLKSYEIDGRLLLTGADAPLANCRQQALEARPCGAAARAAQIIVDDLNP